MSVNLGPKDPKSMIYVFVCDKCGAQLDLEYQPFKPPKAPLCDSLHPLGPKHKPKRMRLAWPSTSDPSS